MIVAFSFIYIHYNLSLQKKILNMKSKLLFILLIITANVTAENKQDSLDIINQLYQEDSYTIEESENKPEESYNDFVYTPQKSVFNVPIEIEVKAVQKALNDNFTGLIYEDNVIEDDSLKLKVWKNGEFKLNYVDDTLTTEIPIKLWATKRFGIAGITYTDREIDAAITVKLQSKLQISKSWGVLSKSKFISYKWDKKPTTKLVGIDVPITYIVDHILNSNKKELELLIDNGIKNNLPTQDYAKQLWAQIQDPIPVEVDSYQAWINMRPTNILMKPIKGEDKKIKTGFSIECNVDVTVGSNNVKNKYITPLPECRLNSKMVPGWQLNLLANIPYSIMDSLAIQNLRGQAFGEGKHSIYVDMVHTYGSGEFLAIELFVHGFINGSIYLTGKPYYDKENVSIRLKEVAYSFKTKNILHKALNMVVKPILKNKLEKKFELPMQENFYLIEQMGQSNILNSQWDDNVFTSGEIKKVEGGDIYITKSGIQAAISVEGTLNVIYK